MTPSNRSPEPILDGAGDNDYARYMRTDVLLSLQRDPAEILHRDEILFQNVHQSTELWLKYACYEVASATECIGDNAISSAVGYLFRASRALELITDQLGMLALITPWDFQQVRGALGNGSGLESPGWRGIRKVTPPLGMAFNEQRDKRGLKLLDLYQAGPAEPLFSLAEALVDWDAAINTWRVRHYQLAVRTIGDTSSGTKGNSVDMLDRLVHHRFFTELWQVRNELTALGRRYGAEGQVIAE